MFFKGTLLITDPCYWYKDEHMPEYYTLENETVMQGRAQSAIASTGIGDWQWVLLSGSKVLGQFTADAGLVSVTTLENLQEYDEDKAKEIVEKLYPHCRAIIPDYEGHISFQFDNKGWVKIISRGSHDFVSELKDREDYEDFFDD